METYPAALAEAVRNRRRQLGLSQHAVMDKSKRLDPRGKGIHIRSVSTIENGARDRYHGSKLTVLDWALSWPAGTCWAVFTGQPRRDVETEAGFEQRLSRIEETIAALTSALTT